jgi:tetratricopeptide (TPR) repeat protein
MPEIPVSSLDVRLQKLVSNARIALDRGNLDYAIEACEQVLKGARGCLPVRKLLRAAQLRRIEGRSRLMAKALGGFSSAPFLFGGGAKKDPAKAFETAEKQLAADPTSVTALKQLAEAALALDLPETAAFACEAVREQQPEDRENLLQLGEAWLAAKRPSEALRVADVILKTRPVDPDAQSLMRRASIAQTVTKGNWDATTTFRDKLKDEAKAVSLEQAAKVVTAGEMTQRLVDEARARIEQEPGNLNHYRDLVQGYRQLGRLDEALVWIRRAREQPAAAADVALEKQEAELQIALLETAVKAADAALAAAPDDRAAQERREQARGDLLVLRLATAQRTVERYPNDFAARQTLGELLLGAGRVDQAIAQFQQAQKGPQVRLAALAGLGRCFKAKRLFDLAVAQFTTAKAELATMDDAKKEIVYELGACLEAMGRPEEAIAEFKTIYQEDIGYRDVAAKIDAYYAAR